jgi:hypothetical protein
MRKGEIKGERNTTSDKSEKQAASKANNRDGIKSTRRDRKAASGQAASEHFSAVRGAAP